MQKRLIFILGFFLTAGLLSGCGKSEKQIQAEAEQKMQVETEAKRVAALSPAQRNAEAREQACTEAKAQFSKCEQMKGDAFVSCLASMTNVPEGCGETNLLNLYEHADGKKK